MPQKKTLVTMFEDFRFEPPDCPTCDSSKKVVKNGNRRVRDESVQIFLCRICKKTFSNRKLPRTSYPPKLILSALTYYNTGHTLDQTASLKQRQVYMA